MGSAGGQTHVRRLDPKMALVSYMPLAVCSTSEGRFTSFLPHDWQTRVEQKPTCRN